MPQKIEALNYFFQGFGIFLGVIAGTAVTLFAQWLVAKQSEKQKIKNVKFELNFMLQQTNSWLLSFSKYRNAINGDALETWAEYITLSKILKTAIIEAYSTGLIYKYLNDSLVSDLQMALSDFSQNMEHVVNQRINEQRTQFDKKRAIIDLNFIDERVKNHQQAIVNALQSLK